MSKGPAEPSYGLVVLLVTAATEAELDGAAGAARLVCGVGLSTPRRARPPSWRGGRSMPSSTSGWRAAARSPAQPSSSGAKRSTAMPTTHAGSSCVSRRTSGSSPRRRAFSRARVSSRSARPHASAGRTGARSRRWRDTPCSERPPSPASPPSRCASSRTPLPSPIGRAGGFPRHSQRSPRRSPDSSRSWMRTRELPPPLPPAERTIGQLVAETIRAYGDTFPRALPLGLPLAVVAQLGAGRPINTQVALLSLAAPFFAAAFASAVWLVSGVRPTLLALALGTIVLVPGARPPARVRPSVARVARAVRARRAGRDDRADRLPRLARPRASARAGRFRTRARDARHARDPLRAHRRDAGLPPPRPGGQRGSRGVVPRGARDQPDAVPGRRAALRRPGGASRLPPTPTKEP